MTMRKLSRHNHSDAGLFTPIVVLSTLLLAGGLPSVALDIYGPPEAGLNLNGNSVFAPFDREGPSRFQQVYDRELFASVTSGGALIYGVSFRVDATMGHSFLTSIPSIQLDISTTAIDSQSLNAAFDLNIGTVKSTVIGPTRMRLFGAGGEGAGFHVNFLWSEPFFYDPANGNLLLDFQIYEGNGNVGAPNGVAILDAFDVPNDSVASVYGYGPSMPTFGQVSSLGLASQIIALPVPEPSTISFLMVGLGLFGGVAWRRNRTRKG